MKTSCACSLGLLGLLVAPVAFGASTGLEVDPPSDTGAACPTPRADVCDRPYPELTRAARKLGTELYEKRVKGAW